VAVSVLGIAGAQVGWEPPIYEETASGLTHAPQFLARAMGAGGVSGSIRRGATKKEARAQAALSLLARRQEMEDPSRDSEATAGAAPQPEGAVVVALGDGVQINPSTSSSPISRSSPISALNEYAQARRLATPSYAYTQRGPAHALLFTCVVTVGSQREQAEGASKAEAKTAAAARLLCALGM
jgi:dsRNA-specific ribonuclease